MLNEAFKGSAMNSFHLTAVLLCLAVNLSCGASEPPASMAPRIVRGADLLTKRRVFHDAKIGDVTDIRLVDSKDDSHVIVVAGTQGAAFLEPETYRVQRVVQYAEQGPPFVQHEVVDVDADGTLEFARDAHSAEDAAVLDDQGKIIWRRAPPGSSFPHAKFGDVDGDKKLECLLWRTFGAQELVDAYGKSVWKQRWDGNISEIIFVDVDADGRDELVSIDGHSLFIRDGAGKLVRHIPIKDAQYVNHLEPTAYPFDEAGSRILLGYNFDEEGELKQTYLVMAADGSSVVADISPDDLLYYRTRLAVKLRGAPAACRISCAPMKYQGVPVGYSATRLCFTLYDDARKPLYEEIIAASADQAIPGDGDVEVVPSADGRESILVGYGYEVWEYRDAAPK
jgi:hypothetical protein